MINKIATQRVQKALDDLVKSGEELGLQVAAYLDGELVIDAWAGLADEGTGRKVDGDTLFTIFSTSKGVTATCIHILADRGAIDYEKPIAYYWPEFAAKGKGEATVRHGLTHQIGIPQMPEGVTPESMCDWEATCKAIANLEPLWKPGTKTGYHAITFGFILGEVLRRVDGRSIARFVQEEINRPLGINDLYFGIPDAVEGRVATLKNAPAPPDSPTPEPGSLRLRAIPARVTTTGEVWNRKDVRRASIPAAGGITNARSLARHYAALADMGGLGKSRLMSAERVEIARALQTEDRDEVLEQSIAKGLGYFLGGAGRPAIGPTAKSFGHPGAGGSLGFCHPEHHLAVGFAKTLLKTVADPRQASAYIVAQEIRAALGVLDAA